MGLMGTSAGGRGLMAPRRLMAGRGLVGTAWPLESWLEHLDETGLVESGMTWELPKAWQHSI